MSWGAFIFNLEKNTQIQNKIVQLLQQIRGFAFVPFTLGVVLSKKPGMSVVDLWVSMPKEKDSSAGDTPSLTFIDTVESLRRLDLCLDNEPSA